MRRNEVSRPRTVGAIPRRTALGVLAGTFAGVTASGWLAGCGSPREQRTVGPYVVAITESTPAVVEGEEASVFQVGRSIALPLKDRPSGLPRTQPYRGAVVFTPDHLRVQMSYVLSNLEDRQVTVAVLVDAWNEFDFYSPQVRVVDDEIVADRSTVDRLVVLPPLSRVRGTVSFDDFERVALALATIGNDAPNPFHVLEPSTEIRESPLAAPYVPPIISGITGFDLSLRSGEAVRVAIEATVELLDLGEVLVPEGSDSKNRRRQDQGRRALVPVVATEEG